MMKMKDLNELALNYDISPELVNEYKNRLFICPLFHGDEESLLECLEEFVGERSSLIQKKEEMSLEDTFSNVLYRKYGIFSLPYLSDSYKDLYHISEEDEYAYELLKEEITFDDEIHDYHGIR